MAFINGKEILFSSIINGEGVEGGASGSPIEIATEAEMTKALETAEVGTIYKYTGTTGTYEKGALYIVEAGE